eukprot:2029995-Rhodomonas_salina.2
MERVALVNPGGESVSVPDIAARKGNASTGHRVGDVMSVPGRGYVSTGHRVGELTSIPDIA